MSTLSIYPSSIFILKFHPLTSYWQICWCWLINFQGVSRSALSICRGLLPCWYTLISDAYWGRMLVALRSDHLLNLGVLFWGVTALSVSTNPCAVNGVQPQYSPGWWCSWLSCSSHSWSGTLVMWAGLQGQGCPGYGWWRLHWLPSGNYDYESGV